MFQFPGFALIPLWIQRISPFIYNPLPQHIDCSMCRDNGSQKVGCPIRKFPDQSLFAAPRNLSQRTTSFIASQRQGIRRIPFRHLIVLEIRKRTVQGAPCQASLKHHRGEQCFASPNQETRLGRRASIHFPIRKDQFCFKHIRDLCGQAQITTGMLSFQIRRWARNYSRAGRRLWARPDMLPLHDVRFLQRGRQSNSRPGYRIPLKPLAPPLIEDRRSAEPFGPRKTIDLQTDISSERHPCGASAASAQISNFLVEPDGIEPTTSCLQSTRSPN